MIKTKSIFNGKTNEHGFTIVELLIVIVVIGVLASVSVVAFNGVRARAIDSEKASETSTIKKKLELFKVKNGYYPCYTDVAGANGVTLLDIPLDGLQTAEQESWITGLTGSAGSAGNGTKGYVITTWPNPDGSGFDQGTGQCQSYSLTYYSYVKNQTIYVRNPEHRGY